MCSEHNTPVSVPQKVPASGLRARFDKTYSKYVRESIDTHSSDPESNEKATLPTSRTPMLDLNHYKVVNQVWHYYSVDWGTNYTCIGYNSLSDIKVASDDVTAEEASPTEDVDDNGEARAELSNHPNGARTWTWLVLCDDGTVISIHEDPFAGHQGALDERHRNRSQRIRRNLLNVFMQLSRVNNAHRRDNPIHTLDIRPGLEANQTVTVTITDSPSLLFYYLFDDWYTSYSLVAKSEHAYAELLETLRQDMFARPKLELIQRLHQYGRQLSVLKRMYQSYALIIQRLLDRQKSVNITSGDAANADTNAAGELSTESRTAAFNTDKFRSPTDETLGAPLTTAATVRFQRLQDRITHYAISEIQECLDEKEALVFLVCPPQPPQILS